MSGRSPLETYSRTAERAAKTVIDGYSTSFGTATALLGPSHRAHVRNIYALVRVADEIVDGMPAGAGMGPAEVEEMFEDFVTETFRALSRGVSTNLIIHAFARTARQTGIGSDLIEPFFAAMRSDLDAESPAGHPAAPGVRCLSAGEHADYVYGSAEVVGLMCLRIFLHDNPRDDAQLPTLECGARRLGAAFQNINFLRDLADDRDRLGRSYLTEEARLSTSARDAWILTIRDQLADAEAAIPLLPYDARLAVGAATALFAALIDTIAAAPVERLYRERIRIPGHVKARLLARSTLGTLRGRSS